MGELQTADGAGPDTETAGEVRAWLDAFAAAVRRADYETGRKLFAPEVVGFGTVGVMLQGVDMLVDGQWKRVWGVTTGFGYDMKHVTCDIIGDVAWVAAPWSSQGRTREGRCFDRRGRATYVLRRRDGRWLAVHSHHSLDPSGAAPGGAPQ